MQTQVVHAAPGAGAISLAQRLARQPGVLSVTLDPVRGQVVVRKHAQAGPRKKLERAETTLGSRATPGASTRADRLVSLWPRLSKLITLLPSLLA